jgi:butyrate kinase
MSRKTDARIALRASLRMESEALEFAGCVADLATMLNEVNRRMVWAGQMGATPGAHTLAAIETVASRLIQATQAYRLARSL